MNGFQNQKFRAKLSCRTLQHELSSNHTNQKPNYRLKTNTRRESHPWNFKFKIKTGNNETIELKTTVDFHCFVQFPLGHLPAYNFLPQEKRTL